MKELCVIYCGVIQKILLDGEFLQGELDIYLEETLLRNSIKLIIMISYVELINSS